jgi:hypothetical protein
MIDIGSPPTESDFARLEACAIPRALVKQAGWFRVTSQEGGTLMGRNGAGDWAGLGIPYFWPGEERPREYRLRRDHPEIEYDAQARPKEKNKYLSPPGRGNLLYFAPGTDPAWLEDVSIPIVITEGEKKTLNLWVLAWHGDTMEPRFLPIGLTGVWNWRGTVGKTKGPNGDRRDVKGPIPDLDRITWAGRKVTVAFDVNVWTNESVQHARSALTRELQKQKRGAKVYYFPWPADTPKSVNGVDDMTAAVGPDRVLELIEQSPAAEQSGQRPAVEPKIYTWVEASKMNVTRPEMAIDNITPKCGANLIVGSSKSGKTIFSVQEAVAIATGSKLFGKYDVLHQGPAMIIEADDNRADPEGKLEEGVAAITDILKVSQAPTEAPIYIVGKPPYEFGDQLIGWLEEKIRKFKLRYLALDSYTKLRPHRKPGCDIVKVEYEELSKLDELAQGTQCTMRIIHHPSKASFKMEWFDSAGGTCALNMAVTSLIHIQRFPELELGSPERLVRIRGRSQGDVEMVLNFRKDTLDFEQALEGAAASCYPDFQTLKRTFGVLCFSPQEVYEQTGISRRSATRMLGHLCFAGVLRKLDYGQYIIA